METRHGYHGPGCRRRCKRKPNNENMQPVDVIDLTVESPARLPKRRPPIAHDETIDLVNPTRPQYLPPSRIVIEPEPSTQSEKSQQLKQTRSKHPADDSDHNTSIPVPKNLICPICLDSERILHEAMSTKCGHIFCQSCLKRALQNRKKCPKCNKPVQERQCNRLYFDFN